MATGISLHIGLNFVDPSHYEGWDGELSACEADAKDMLLLAKSQKITNNTVLLTEKATATAVTEAITAAAKTLKKGDLFFLTYSGHGGQVRDTNGDEDRTDKERMDETWVLFDRQLVDDELFELWRLFKPGVRILVLSDSCHSGTVVRDIPDSVRGGPRNRAMPRSVGKRVEKKHSKLYRDIQDDHRSAEKAEVKASIIQISGCMDNQLSRDGDRNGLFTGTMLKVWNKGKFPGNYRKFRDVIVAKMPEIQTPNYYVIGASNPTFEAEKPFTL